MPHVLSIEADLAKVANGDHILNVLVVRCGQTGDAAGAVRLHAWHAEGEHGDELARGGGAKQLEDLVVKRWGGVSEEVVVVEAVVAAEAVEAVEAVEVSGGEWR